MGRKIHSKVLFITTSPRSPHKMIPEIELLNNCFAGQKWNKTTQHNFMDMLRKENFFHGEGAKDPTFSARDRITRAPKSLGFVVLSPYIKLTPAGEQLISSRRKDEIFLRQLLKFQIPSPYHIPAENAAKFWIKPYLELLRLIRHFGSLKFDELVIFGLQLTDYRQFENVVEKINRFRREKAENRGKYKSFRREYLNSELKNIYRSDIISGNTRTRETQDRSPQKFLSTKARNMRDYADACFRYLRATGLVNISHLGNSISIIPERIEDVDYLLRTIEREPCLIDNEAEYITYLGDPSIPSLLTDDRALLQTKIKTEFPQLEFAITDPLQDLKTIYADELENRKSQMISRQVTEIKDNRKYDDICNTFLGILDNSLYDIPLMLEWNTWRAMTMLDGGEIRANLKFDDFGNPIATAPGNMADIVCDYGNFGLTVEVTMQSGQKQYDTEGEPVTRHLAKYKKEKQKPAYCLFIAPKINKGCIAHFYALHKINVQYYKGTSTIIPLPLEIFIKMVEDSYKADYVPGPENIRRFLERSDELAKRAEDEIVWYDGIIKEALNWLGN